MADIAKATVRQQEARIRELEAETADLRKKLSAALEKQVDTDKRLKAETRPEVGACERDEIVLPLEKPPLAKRTRIQQKQGIDSAGLSIQYQEHDESTLLQADPTKCSLRESDPLKGEINSPNPVTLRVVDCAGEPLGCATNVVAELKAITDESTTLSCVVNEKDGGLKEIMCEPHKAGRHLLTVKVDSVEIPGSPFTMFVSDPSTSVHEPVHVLPVPDCPNCNRIAITDTRIVATAWTKHWVCVFNKNGELLHKFGSEGQSEGQVMHPNGVVVDGQRCIYVADWGNNRIQKFTTNGEFIKSFGSQGTGQGQFQSLTGMRRCSDGKLYVCEFKNHRVQVFDRDLTFVMSFGSYGKGEGQLRYPEDVAIDSKGLVYVADGKNNRIQVFNPDGTYVRSFGSPGSGPSELNLPNGIHIDSKDTVYVSERCNNRVSIFRSSGKYVTSFGTYGNDPGCFDEPLGISVDDDGFIYVCDSLNDRFQVF